MDSEILFALANQNRAYLRQWFPWIDNTKSVEDIRKFIKGFEDKAKTNKGLLLGIWYQGNLCGLVDLHDINWENRKASIGYWLSEDYQGKGIMSQCCKALIDYAFHELNLNRIEIRAAAENKKSRAIPERLG